MEKAMINKRILPGMLVIIITFVMTLAGCDEPDDDESDTWTFENAPYGAHEKQTFNVIMPEAGNNVHVIVYIHGGFYYSGNKLWYPLFLKDFSENNIFVTMDYRLLGNNIHLKDMIEDVDNALKKINDMANENGCQY
jgi:acetyl esterase/lipase